MFWVRPHCPENKADFREYKGGSPLEEKFTSNPWKWWLVSYNYWEIFPAGDFLLFTYGNLPDFLEKLIFLERFHAEVIKTGRSGMVSGLTVAQCGFWSSELKCSTGITPAVERPKWAAAPDLRLLPDFSSQAIGSNVDSILVTSPRPPAVDPFPQQLHDVLGILLWLPDGFQFYLRF